jgi:FKBP-type peptidyl-prolyl cis-trans isomerase SlyD
MRPWAVLAAIILVLLATVATPSATRSQETKPAEAKPMIGAGSQVSLEYTLRDDAGSVLDSNKGQTPLRFTQGSEQILPALERALVGMHAGDEKQVVVKAIDGYGEMDPAAVTEVPKERIPADALAVGAELVAHNAMGESRVVRVKEIKQDTVVIDLNHPLAGKTLHFDVKVMDVEPPAK